MVDRLLESPAQNNFRQYDEDFYGLAYFKIDGKEYAAGTVEQAKVAARRIARECPDMISPELIIQYSCLPPQSINLVQHLCDGCYLDTTVVRSLLDPIITDWEGLLDAAIAARGEEEFLSVYTEGNPEYCLSDFPDAYARLILQALDLPTTQIDTVRLYSLG
jgi:hypothetical protein